jgi:uncharacterized protein (TIGR02452 family)
MSNIKTSKFLSLVLRHDPARISITLDDAGWTDVAALLAACAAHGVTITRAQLETIVAESDKQRFALSPDGTRIRANQGHSVDVELQLPVATPPAVLYHGTVERVLASIRAQGLIKGARHHVHLSADVETAKKVGGRRGAPILLEVRATEMVAAGHVFHISANGVWLTEHVPPHFLDVPAAPRGKLRRQLEAAVTDALAQDPKHESPGRGPRVAIAKQTLAACDAGYYTNPRGERIELASLIEHAAAGTELHELGRGGLRAPSRRYTTAITVTPESTIAALVRLAGEKHLACLNFASAKNPGGGFLSGAQAQEESLARASALYPCQLEQPDHYARNRANRSALYLDLALFSPDVPFIRDDDGGWLPRAVCASVITCAAPNAGALRQHGRFDAAEVAATLRRRAAFVLAIAAHHGVEDLVLGAWGAGVFGNDPVMVADAFGALLDADYAGVFASVDFAILPGPNLAAFATRFARA